MRWLERFVAQIEANYEQAQIDRTLETAERDMRRDRVPPKYIAESLAQLRQDLEATS